MKTLLELLRIVIIFTFFGTLGGGNQGMSIC
ncbi:hypothetical protein HMPREF1210_00537 [Paenisporosarcina sp. HGH0030]|nr:hypothetical protein HMPREF1210_00537 [Paenisporosarcina sp. HGH0030]